MNEKIAMAEANAQAGDSRLEVRIEELEKQLKGLAGMFGDATGLKGGLQRLQDELKALKDTDKAQGKDIKELQDAINDELEARISLLMKSRDDLLTRIEMCEQENERLNHDTRAEVD